jgi:hypothetical protein
MKTDEAEVQKLQDEVRAAEEEFISALLCHEAWKPAAYDQALHERIAHSYAGNTFLIVRQALRREMLMALMRLWDNSSTSIRMSSIARRLKNPRVFSALVAQSAARWGDEPYTVSEIHHDLWEKAKEAISIIERYERQGSSFNTLDKLRALRNQRLAHRHLGPSDGKKSDQDAYDTMTDALYQDTFTLIQLLLHVVHKTAFDPEEAAQVHAHYAKYFWAAVRSERTEGHPSYRAPLDQPSNLA